MVEACRVGGIELGGTKIVLALGDSDGQIGRREVVPTASPAAAVEAIGGFFGDAPDLVGLGVAAFGPIVLDPAAADHGRLLETNKPGWSHFDLVGALGSSLGLPVQLATDVGAAAIAEARLGALRDCRLGVYLTVGTGIGGAIVLDGAVLPALLHPEMGHVALQRQPGDQAPSACQFHADCAEGLAGGPAIAARFGQSLSHFAPHSAPHRLVADYLGQLCANLVLTLSPHRIVLGGGVGQTPGLIPAVHRALLRHLGGYAGAAVAAEGYVCAPALGQDAGIVGALLAAVPKAA